MLSTEDITEYFHFDECGLLKIAVGIDHSVYLQPKICSFFKPNPTKIDSTVLNVIFNQNVEVR